MRQFVTLGFWLSLLALAGLTFGLVALVRDDAPADSEPTSGVEGDAGMVDGGAADDADPSDAEPVDREIDLISMVFLAQADPGFAIVDGRTTGNMQIRVDGFRFMNIMSGTPGENRCGALAELAQCAVAADLLGEAVLWFSIVPLSPRNLVELPGPASLVEGTRLRLQNGWVVDRATFIDRECPEDTSSLAEFIERFGAEATTVYSLDELQVIRVQCSDDVVATTTP